MRDKLEAGVILRASVVLVTLILVVLFAAAGVNVGWTITVAAVGAMAYLVVAVLWVRVEDDDGGF